MPSGGGNIEMDAYECHLLLSIRTKWYQDIKID